MEQPKNGQVDQQIRRRPLRADATSRTTDGFSRSHSFGLRDSQGSPNSRRSSYRPTPNDYHDNDSANCANGSNDVNSDAPVATARKGKDTTLRYAWELPDLIQPLHRRRIHFVKQPRLLRHYPAIVEFTYNHRYAAGFQIQKQFNDYMPNARTGRYQLASLADLGFLQRAPVRSTSPNFPAVFAATRRGIGLVKQTYADLGIKWNAVATEQLKPHGIALDSILHELLLTEFDQGVRATVQSRGEVRLLMHERRYFRADKQLRFRLSDTYHRLIPDAGFLLRLGPDASRTMSQRHTLQMNFVELDNGTLSVARLAAKYDAYTYWSASDEGQQYLRNLYRRHGGVCDWPNFRLLIVAHDKSNDHHRLIELFVLAFELPRTMRERIWLTTVTDLQLHQYDDPPLSAPLWYRLRDARAWVPTLRSVLSGRSRNDCVRTRAFVAEHLPQLPRHSLLPVRSVPDFS